MENVLYAIAYCLCYLVSLLPLRLLYIASDALCPLLYHVARYRRHIVRKNLTASFPEKPIDEIKKIERQYYLWLCDYVVETIKLFTISPEQMRRRMVFKNTEEVERSVAEGRSCAVYLGHVGNWEWITSLPLSMSEAATCMQIYHPLESPVFDRLFLRLRGRLGAESVSMGDTLRRIIERRNEGKNLVIGFIADQVPLWNSIHYWTDFLHHDTPVFTGTERIARKCGMDVYYMEVTCVKRGYYEAEFKLMTRNATESKEFEITEHYFRLLEGTINAHPSYWLWSHNRWKRDHKTWEQINEQRSAAQ